jgi:membrane fusion protein (multidrug efflux system)
VTADAFIETDMISLAPRVSGQIVEMLVEDNERVSAGQLLCRIDPAPYERLVAEDRAHLEVAEAELAARRTELRRLEERVPQEISLAEQSVAVAESEVRGAEHALAQSADSIGHEITAAEQAVKAATSTAEFARVTLERFDALVESRSVAREDRDAKRTALDTALAHLEQAKVKLAQARSSENLVRIAAETLNAGRRRLVQAQTQLALAKLRRIDIEEAAEQVEIAQRAVTAAQARLAAHELDLSYTAVTAPFVAIVARRYQFVGDHGTPGVPIFSVYDPQNLFVTANMPETRIHGIEPGHQVGLAVDAFPEPFAGRVLWVGRATGAQFALVPRDLTSGEFTKVVQRVPIRILIHEDERRSRLLPGLSVTVSISRREPEQ